MKICASLKIEFSDIKAIFISPHAFYKQWNSDDRSTLKYITFKRKKINYLCKTVQRSTTNDTNKENTHYILSRIIHRKIEKNQTNKRMNTEKHIHTILMKQS